ncbi:hypothetical protein QA612_20595 [Evansella sp. AB-P1]|nr:hypothetical protein [Evansella sp. AB-P1]MDG5789859.1 hypothetical protein [Evansella sp. AB-P1]
MAWYSYFLLSFPEAFLMITLSFLLVGITVKDKLKPHLLFSMLYGLIAF